MGKAAANTAAQAQWRVERPGGDRLRVHLSGDWTGAAGIPAPEQLMQEIAADPSVKRVEFDSREMGAWDAGLPIFLTNIVTQAKTRGLEVALEGLPEGARRLLALAAAVPEKKGAHQPARRESFLSFTGKATIAFVRSAHELLAFMGSAVIAFGKLVRGRAAYRRVDLFLFMQECGAQALPIVTLISALVGMILSFVGAYQLKMFGAEIYIAAGVGIGMVREMAPIMTGIIMAGRTGASFAAQIGTMEVNEEIDAFRTMGIPPIEFLVVPRIISLGLMLPMLCLYADLMGIAGGALVASSMFDIPIHQYVEQTRASVGLTDVSLGVLKSGLFGVVVATTGCLKGMKCGRSASAVGDAATAAVVTGIVAIIVLDSFFAILTTVLGI